MASRTGRLHGRVEGAAERCGVPGCREQGEFRAPLVPGDFDGPGAWRWLCLEHVREHNSHYNFFDGMTPDEIEAAQSPIAGWERHSRAFSTAGDRRLCRLDFIGSHAVEEIVVGIMFANMLEAQPAPRARAVEIAWDRRRAELAGLAAAGHAATLGRTLDPPM